MTEVVLAFDCAVQGLGVAVVRDGVTLASRREQGRDQAARLVPAIASAMAEARVDKRTLSLVAVTTGPGSFTGVRVGLATGRGLAIPLAGIATTACLLAQARPGDRLAVAAIDTHLGDWFCAIAAGDPAASEVSQAPFVASTEGLAGKLAGRPCVVVGLEAERLAPLLADAWPEVALPDPAVVARLALAQGTGTWTVRNRAEGLPRPLYLRGVSITTPDGTRRTVE